MTMTPGKSIGLFAVIILAMDQLSKWGVLRYLNYAEEKVVVPGLFKFVHWGNTGMAWSLFPGNNELLAIIALIALLVLFLTRHHFDTRTGLGQLAFGMVLGGIAGNLVDRLIPARGHVIDFIYFYVERRGGGEIGFPAFNIADAAICIGVVIIFVINLKNERGVKEAVVPRQESAGDSVNREA